MFTNENVGVLIVSCDKYEDAWIPCSLSIEKNWKTCPYEIALLTESKKAPNGTAFNRTINVSTSVWTSGLNEGIRLWNKEYIIVLLEDQWPAKIVNQDAIDKAVEYISSNADIGAIYFETTDIGGLKKTVRLDEDFNEIPYGAPYRLSCAPGVFKADFLLRVTETPESAWDFERIRSLSDEGKECRVLEIYGVNWKRVDGPGAIARGKWVRKMKEYANEIGYDISSSGRGFVSLKDILNAKIKDLIFSLNPDAMVNIQNKLNKK